MMITITNEDLSRLVRIISDLTGNNVQERNHPMVRSRMINRISKLGLASMEDYWTFYEDNAIDERAALQGLMTTHHTFFFREYAHFEALESWINENSLRLKKRFNATKAPLRVWSAACSRGQEVYSLAMFLEFILVQRHGIPYKILGTDIDAASVDFARNGVYPIKEVNTIPTQYLSGYWKRGTGSIKEFAAAHPRLRENTEFTTMNLLAIKTAAVKFDVIFARNVFIYFTEENVQKIALGLKENMADHGFFASGLSEPLRFDGWDLPSPSPSCYVKIPVDQKMQSQASISPTATPSSLTTMPESLLYKVLCVDDSPTIQSIMQKIFSSDPNCSGVVSAFNGIDAREKLDTDKFDLVTLDIHMPLMGGIEFLEKSYQKRKDPPVLIISSVNRTDVDLATKALRLGAFDYIEKPAMNNLQKSVDEILTKTKMALRSSKSGHISPDADDFNSSIGEKIVVPDASQCIRWVTTTALSTHLLEPILRMQMTEFRSPPLVISTPQNDLQEIEAKVRLWSPRNVEHLRQAKVFLRPNFVYLCDSSLEADVAEALKVKSFSLQILSSPQNDLAAFSRFKNAQVLMDESLAGLVEKTISRSGLSLSDITPSTSFVSLSLEYFANIRKAKAA